MIGAALAEARWGAARGLSDFAYVTVGTGVGVGLIAAGRAVHGWHHPELGHVRVQRLSGDDWPGHCRFHGDCVEGLAAGPAIEARAGAPPASLAADHPVWEQVAHALAQLAHTLVVATAPQRILFGGGVMNAQPQLLARIRERLRLSLNGYMAIEQVPGGLEAHIAPPGLGERAGPLGRAGAGGRRARGRCTRAGAGMNRDSQRFAFASITTLFFAWGFITVTIDPLIASLKAIFSLSYAEVMLTQFAFFLAYGVVSLPGAALVRRLGYERSIVVALGVMIVGCLVVPVATHFETFALVLVALFILAGGITVLQVAANPLAAALGAPERAHYRLTLSQAFNSLGTALAPYLMSSVVLTGGMFAVEGAASAAQRAESLRHIDLAFLAMAALIALLAVFI